MSTKKELTIYAKQYQLQDLVPGTMYTVAITVDLGETGTGDPRFVYFTTESDGMFLFVSLDILNPGFSPWFVYGAELVFLIYYYY